MNDSEPLEISYRAHLEASRDMSGCNVLAPVDKCARVAQHGRHGHFICYRRPARRLFRKTYVIVCWGCQLSIYEP